MIIYQAMMLSQIASMRTYESALHQEYLSKVNTGLKLGLEPNQLDLVIAPLDSRHYSIHDDVREYCEAYKKDYMIFGQFGPQGVGTLSVACIW